MNDALLIIDMLNDFVLPGAPLEVPETRTIIDAVRHAIDEVTVRCDGSISAEHGIGRLKTGDLNTYASSAKLQAIRQIKAALDPHNIMNPGAIHSK